MGGRFLRQSQSGFPDPAVQRLLTILALCSLLPWLAGCSRPRAEGRADFVLINGGEVGTIDPARASSQMDGRLVTSLFEGLLRFNEQGEPEPGCALEPVISADGREWTFSIRPEAKWSDGSPVTAQDFVTSWNRVVSPALAADYAEVFTLIEGGAEVMARKAEQISGLKAPDDRTLVVRLVNPVPYFKGLAAFMSFCPVHTAALAKHGRAYWKPENIVCNGPYQMVEWRLNDRIRLVKNPHYWDAANVQMATVDVLPIGNANTAINFFLTGEADLIMDKGLIPNSIADQLKTKPYFRSKPFLGTWFVRFNVTQKNKPWADARVRRALTMVIDRERIVNVVTRLGEPAATTMTPPGIGTYTAPAGLSRNAEAARQLLAEAGYPGGKGFPVLNYLYPSQFPSDNGIAIELQSMWEKELGIKVSLQRQEYKVYLDSQKSLDYDLSRSSWVGDYNDPNTFLDCFVSGGGNNRTGWKSPEYDQLLSAAAAEPDADARNELLRKAEQILVENECPVIPVYHYVGVQFYHPDKFGGISGNLTDEHPLRCIYRK